MDDNPAAALEPRAIGGDRPKDKLSEDRLGYANFARAIARSLFGMTATEGIVLAIHGEWGSGKTSVVNMVNDALDSLQKSAGDRKKILTVRFNPWWFSEQQDLTRAFFSEVSAALGTKVSSEVREGLKKVAKRVSGAKDLVLAALSPLPMGDFVKSAASDLIALAGSALDEGRSLDEERNALCDALRTEGKRILVVIDDIDRLPAGKVRQIFRLVKSVADLPNVIYLLVFDRAIASRALAQSSDPEGPEWLEKIVQASFDLPPIHPVDLQRLFLEGLETTLGAPELADPTRWGNVYFDAIKPWLRTPRDVGRLLNTLSVSWPAVAGEVDVPDFIAVETLRLFEPRLHAFTRRYPSDLTGLSEGSSGARQPTIGDKILACVDETKRERVKTGLERLFPRLESVWGNHSYDFSFLAIWDRERRICSPKRFPAYFTFGIGEDVLPKAELEDFLDFLHDPRTVSETIKRYTSQQRRSGGTRAAVLLDELLSNLDEIDPERVAAAISSLLYARDLFMNAADDRGNVFSISAVRKVWWAVDSLLHRLQATDRLTILWAAIETSPSLYAISFGVLALAWEHGRHTDEAPEAEDRRLLDEASVLELETTLAHRLRKAAADGSLLAHNEMHSLMRNWASVAGALEVRAWTDKLVNSDVYILRLIEAVTEIRYSHTEGDRVTRNFPIVHRSSLESMIDMERLLQRLSEIERSPLLSAKESEVISRFRHGLAFTARF